MTKPGMHQGAARSVDFGSHHPSGATDELAYCRRRLAEEEARSFEAGSRAARAAHRRLALLYWEKIERLEIGCTKPPASDPE